jgi:acetyltransferase
LPEGNVDRGQEAFVALQKREQVQGVRAYASVSALPEVPDLTVVCTPALSVPPLVEECGRIGVNGMILLTAGFKETGADGLPIEWQLHEARGRYRDLRIIGPNCLGVISPRYCLNASFATTMPAAGNVAVISQSGALCTALLD